MLASASLTAGGETDTVKGLPGGVCSVNLRRSIYQHVSIVAVDPSGAAYAALQHAIAHAMGSKTMQRSPALPPVLTSYKLLEIERTAIN